MALTSENMNMGLEIASLGAILGAVFLLSLGLVRLALFWMMPLFRRYALARPNARSSHKTPIPQGAGLAYMPITLIIGLGAVMILAEKNHPYTLSFCGFICAMVLLGAGDDIRPLSWRLRLAIQSMIVAGILVILPHEWRVFPAFPLFAERAFALILGLWFVNLTNFMDGIDGILVMGLAPLALGLGTGFGGIIPPDPFALAFAGALCGFFIVNRPPAQVFSGDAGALAAGLLAASLLYKLAAQHDLVAALILPLYFGMDATQTLFIRLFARKNVTEAHRDHAYQNAVDAGWSTAKVIMHVAVLNIILVFLAGIALWWNFIRIPALCLALLLTFLLISHFRADKKKQARRMKKGGERAMEHP